MWEIALPPPTPGQTPLTAVASRNQLIIYYFVVVVAVVVVVEFMTTQPHVISFRLSLLLNSQSVLLLLKPHRQPHRYSPSVLSVLSSLEAVSVNWWLYMYATVL